MNIDEVLLTEKERISICEKCNDWMEHKTCYNRIEYCEHHLAAQSLKLLEWLIKERLVVHENYSEFKDYEKHFKNWHKADCQVCELESKLKEG